jgi:iron(III) transport system ATP-binding protein
LLDEPLSNLDAKVREQARIWLRDIQRRLGITTVYVTHDQAEALAMSDKIAVMYSGKLQQYDTPQTIYEKPATRFVAEFIGATAFLKGTIVEANSNYARIKLPDGTSLHSTRLSSSAPKADDEVNIAIRSERVQLANSAHTENTINGRITSSDYLGSKWHHAVETSAGLMKIETLDAASGNVRLFLPPDALIILKD